MNIDFKISDFLKLPMKIMCSICIATGLILFLPDIIMKRLYLETFRNKYGFTIGAIFILTTSIILINFVILIYKVVENKYYKIKFRKSSENILLNLSTYQKGIVYGLYKEYNHTAELPIYDGAVVELKNKGIIIETTTQYLTTNFEPKFPYTLQPWVVKKLNDVPEILAKIQKEIHENV